MVEEEKGRRGRRERRVGAMVDGRMSMIQSPPSHARSPLSSYARPPPPPPSHPYPLSPPPLPGWSAHLHVFGGHRGAVDMSGGGG